MSDIHDKLDKKLINLCLKEAPSLGDINKVSDEIIALVREHDRKADYIDEAKVMFDALDKARADERQRCVDAVDALPNEADLYDAVEAIKGLDDE